MPNEIFSLGLDASEIAVYAYLRCLENRSSYQCWPSYTTIGNAVGRAKNTVMRYVDALAEKGLIGKNVSKDTSTAAEYLRQAADNGSAYAQYLLGKLTLMGEGVPKDPDTAYEWFAAARDNGHTYAEFFLKRMERGEQEPPSVLLSATRLLYHMGNIFRDNAPAPAATGVQIDRKRLAQMRQKRVALGHKPDDHELEQQQGFSMKFHM